MAGHRRADTVQCVEFKVLLLLLACGSMAAGLYLVNVTLLSRVTLIRKLQSTSDLDHFHARDLSSSRVKTRDDPISDCRGDSTVPYSFISIDIYILILCHFYIHIFPSQLQVLLYTFQVIILY